MGGFPFAKLMKDAVVSQVLIRFRPPGSRRQASPSSARGLVLPTAANREQYHPGLNFNLNVSCSRMRMIIRATLMTHET